MQDSTNITANEETFNNPNTDNSWCCSSAKEIASNKNPFLDRHKTSFPDFNSPSVFRFQPTPVSSCKPFQWSVEEIAILRPADIEELPNQEVVDNSYFMTPRRAEVSTKFFSMKNSIPTLMTPSTVSRFVNKTNVNSTLKLDSPNPYSFSHPPEMLEPSTSTTPYQIKSPMRVKGLSHESDSVSAKNTTVHFLAQSCSATQSQRKTAVDSGVQTMVTLPLDFDLDNMLGRSVSSQEEDSSTSIPSIRRILFKHPTSSQTHGSAPSGENISFPIVQFRSPGLHSKSPTSPIPRSGRRLLESPAPWSQTPIFGSNSTQALPRQTFPCSTTLLDTQETPKTAKSIKHPLPKSKKSRRSRKISIKRHPFSSLDITPSTPGLLYSLMSGRLECSDINSSIGDLPCVSPIIPQEISVSPIIPQEISVSPIIPQEISVSPIIPQEISVSPIIPQEISVSPIIPQEISVSPIIPQEISVSPIIPQEISVSPIIPQEISASPIRSQQNPVSPIIPQEISASPIRSQQNPVSPIIFQKNPVSPITFQQNCVSPITSQKNVSRKGEESPGVCSTPKPASEHENSLPQSNQPIPMSPITYCQHSPLRTLSRSYEATSTPLLDTKTPPPRRLTILPILSSPVCCPEDPRSLQQSPSHSPVREVLLGNYQEDPAPPVLSDMYSISDKLQATHSLEGDSGIGSSYWEQSPLFQTQYKNRIKQRDHQLSFSCSLENTSNKSNSSPSNEQMTKMRIKRNHVKFDSSLYQVRQTVNDSQEPKRYQLDSTGRDHFNIPTSPKDTEISNLNLTFPDPGLVQQQAKQIETIGKLRNFNNWNTHKKNIEMRTNNPINSHRPSHPLPLSPNL